MTKNTIEVDDDVFSLLQENARPLLDTPNDVLRRLLLNEKQERGTPMLQPSQPDECRSPRPASDAPRSEAFVRQIIAKEFGGGFRRLGRYRMMFQGEDRLVYFQNYNKETDHLWYRVTKDPWKLLKANGRNAWICFTNPAERYAYLIPVADVIAKVHRAGWSRDYLEVNIDPGTSRWTELNWDLSDYRKVY